MPLSQFHPTVRAWFEAELGAPTPAQREGWRAIHRGEHTLIAAPTGSGKTLAAFLVSVDALLREPTLPDETRVLYLSPLKALANDVQKNLDGPLAALRALDPSLPEVRTHVRTGDTPHKARAAATRKAPHLLVTTPESLYVLLTSDSGRRMLRSVRTVIVDEVHALARDKRGSHLALSLERLSALCSHPVQRIGLSATQKPIEDMAGFLVGASRACSVIDTGHLRTLDLALEVPSAPLSAVCSHETWEEIYARIAAQVAEHRTTLVFVNTRKLAERIAARLIPLLGEDAVTCHHGSLSAERRLSAEQRLKSGSLRALVATASLELGIDVGEVDLVVQIGSCRSIATLLQRIGRAGHGVGRIPKGRLFPLTLDELVEAEASLGAIRAGVLDRTLIPSCPLDILAQQIVAATVAHEWREDTLFACVRQATPFADLPRAHFDQVLALHARGRHALLHRDGVHGIVRATKRAKLVALTGGGAIPDVADYRVLEEPEGTFVGTLNEDFAIESNAGDVFQLGTTSWRILRVEPGIVRVASAAGALPTIPFWLGEAPARTKELAAAIDDVRTGFVARQDAAGQQLHDYLETGKRELGVIPSATDVVIERFFDESGGMQLIVHAPFGGRINRAWGLTLRKRFCRGFGFELQAAANEEAIILSLGEQHSFPLDEVFDYLHPDTARELLVQALLDAPMFKTRWRWNVSRSLLLERTRGGRRVPPPLLRMRAEDLLAQSFPGAVACPETLPAGDIEIPTDHPIVRQTLDDCLNEAMDVDGFLLVLRGLRDGSIRRHSVDTTQPSVFAQGILTAQPYSFLDDAPLEERRTQAVQRRGRSLSIEPEGILDPEAIRRVREEAWPAPDSAEEVHEALGWMGWVGDAECPTWHHWLAELQTARRVVREGDRWYAVESTRDPKELWRGRLEALGPVVSDDTELLLLETEGFAIRVDIAGTRHWCSRRLLARIHRYTLDRLRREIEPVSAADLLRFLAAWQHLGEHRLEGVRGVLTVVEQLAGYELPAAAWEAHVLPARVRDYQSEWLDQLTLSGEIAWGRLWGTGASTLRSTPLALMPRDRLEAWTALTQTPHVRGLSDPAQRLHRALRERGAMFPRELGRTCELTQAELDEALGELVASGAVTCDSFGALRTLLHMGKPALGQAARWSLFRDRLEADAEAPMHVARALLARTGVVFKRTTAREGQPLPWRDLLRAFRTLEARGEIRGGRFVAGFDGEQYALPDAVAMLRATRRRPAGPEIRVSASDPLNYVGILTPDARISPLLRTDVRVA